MSTAIIEVAFADPPKDGKKQATIKTQDGQIYGVWPDKFGLLQPGKAYEIEFSERDYQGKKYRTIVKCKPKEISKSNPARPSPDPSGGALTGEQEFVARLLAASVQACAVTYSEPGLIAAAKMLRKVYRESF